MNDPSTEVNPDLDSTSGPEVGKGSFPSQDPDTTIRLTPKESTMAYHELLDQEQLRDLPPLAELSDEELVTAHLGGRPGAFQHLYDRFRDRLVHFIIRKTGDADRAQDLVQEAFIRVTRHLHRFDTEKKFSTWIYTIASNLSKNELRNRSRSPLVLFQKLERSWDEDHRPLQFEDSRMRPDDMYHKRYLQQIVEETVEELPEHHRLVFRLRELEGKSYEDIAEITGVNLGTVKSRLHRARNSFAQRIEPLLN
jgi:RNA polymerase sigma-70 factor, ECF subfamily